MDNENKKNKICNCAGRGLSAMGCGRQDRQLNTYDWLADVPGNTEETDLIEVQFKNTRKGYYHNVNNLELKKGDIVVYESTVYPGVTEEECLPVVERVSGLKYNQDFLDKIMAANNKGELDDVYNEMAKNAFLKFWFDKNEFEKDNCYIFYCSYEILFSQT